MLRQSLHEMMRMRKMEERVFWLEEIGRYRLVVRTERTRQWAE
jgi:hypothetical protein